MTTVESARRMAQTKEARRREQKRQLWNIFGRVMLYALLVGVSLWYLAPLFWMFMTSFMPLEQVGIFPPEWIPRQWQFHNYTDALDFWDFGNSLKNTLIITIFSLIGDLVSSTLVAYGFARFRFPYRDALFLILLATLMLPFAVRLIPVYIVYNKIGWVNTFWPLIAPNYFGSAFFIFICQQFFLGIPQDLLDAAKIDGAQRVPHLYPSHGAACQASHCRHRDLELPKQLERLSRSLDLSARREAAHACSRIVQIPEFARARRGNTICRWRLPS